MANIIITIPKTIKWKDYEREIEAVKGAESAGPGPGDDRTA